LAGGGFQHLRWLIEIEQKSRKALQFPFGVAGLFGVWVGAKEVLAFGFQLLAEGKK
jgi:hypothetical protein